MFWTVKHHWMAGSLFEFNLYKHWEKLIFRQPGKEPVIINIQEGVTQGYPLSIVLYVITPITLEEDLWTADPAPFMGGISRVHAY